jgi:hypothetical protein
MEVNESQTCCQSITKGWKSMGLKTLPHFMEKSSQEKVEVSNHIIWLGTWYFWKLCLIHKLLSEMVGIS